MEWGLYFSLFQHILALSIMKQMLTVAKNIYIGSLSEPYELFDGAWSS